MNFLMSIGLKAWGYIAAAATAVIGLLTLFAKVKQAGRDEVIKLENERAAEANKRMLDAAVQAPKGKEDVVKDLRAGRF